MSVIDVVFPELPVVPDDRAWLGDDERRVLADEIEAELRDVERLVRRCQARTAALLDVADRAGVVGLDGHRTIRSYAAATVNWSNAECLHVDRVVGLLRVLPEIADDLDAGTIAIAPVRELARLRANPRCGDRLAGGSADTLIQAAKDLPFEQFRQVAQAWEQRADADGAHRSHDAAHTGRRVTTPRSMTRSTWQPSSVPSTAPPSSRSCAASKKPSSAPSGTSSPPATATR